jgi:hypothetical protein
MSADPNSLAAYLNNPWSDQLQAQQKYQSVALRLRSAIYSEGCGYSSGFQLGIAATRRCHQCQPCRPCKRKARFQTRDGHEAEIQVSRLQQLVSSDTIAILN